MRKAIATFVLIFSCSTATALAAVQPQFTDGVQTFTSSSINKSVAYFEYSPELQYEINTQSGYITDLQFRNGDSIVSALAGDTQRWMIETVTVDGIPHVYIKPTIEEITTNIIVNTNRRTYRLIVHSTNSYVPVVAWSYPEDRVVTADDKKDQTKVDSALAALHYNYNYTVKAKKQGWIPKTIYDDGIRTFIKIPVDVKNDLPVIHILDDKKTGELVNYRVQDRWFIVDRVFKKAVLNFTAEQLITIENMKGEEK